MLVTLSSAAGASLVGAPGLFAQRDGLETSTIRLVKIPGICVAPQYVAEDLLKAEGFTTVEYFDAPRPGDQYTSFAAGKFDITMAFVAPFILQVNSGVPIVLLGGIHAGCFEVADLGQQGLVPDLKKIEGAGRHLLGLINDILCSRGILTSNTTSEWLGVP